MGALARLFTLSLVMLLVACTPSPFDGYMATLRDDPMTTAEWSHLETRSLSEQTKGEIMDGQPSLTRCFVVADGEPAQAMDDIVATAEGYGWEPDPGLTTNTTKVSARKDSANNRFSLVVSTDRLGCEDLVNELSVIRLTLKHL